jgi:hypothetical protein
MKPVLIAAAIIAAACLALPAPAGTHLDVGSPPAAPYAEAAPGCVQPTYAPAYAAPGCAQPALQQPVAPAAPVQLQTPPQTYRVQGPPKLMTYEAPGDYYDVTVPGQTIGVALTPQAAPCTTCPAAAPVYSPAYQAAPCVPAAVPAYAPEVQVDVGGEDVYRKARFRTWRRNRVEARAEAAPRLMVLRRPGRLSVAAAPVCGY